MTGDRENPIFITSHKYWPFVNKQCSALAIFLTMSGIINTSIYYKNKCITILLIMYIKTMQKSFLKSKKCLR